MPGSELIFHRESGEERILSSSLGDPEKLDIRSPEVSYDGKFVAFEMRRKADEPIDVWEIEIATGMPRQLTFSTNSKIHFREPLYIVDSVWGKRHEVGQSALVVSSNRNQGLAVVKSANLLGEAEGGTRLEIKDSARSERPGHFANRTLEILDGENAGQIREVRTSDTGILYLKTPLPFPMRRHRHYLIKEEQRVANRYDLFKLIRPSPGKDSFEENLIQLTHSVDAMRRPTNRSSGEIMFTLIREGWQAGRPFFNGAQFRVHMDGSNLHTHNGNRSGIPIHSDNRELPNGLEVRIGRSPDSYWGGMLMISDHQFGPTVEEHNPLDLLDFP
ncbi:MAG: hypothetical protein KDD43_02680, partial [Bdellovibrionales bacterium]|nr:hypothetical protein [Bdellovibrionales bacterium]